MVQPKPGESFYGPTSYGNLTDALRTQKAAFGVGSAFDLNDESGVVQFVTEMFTFSFTPEEVDLLIDALSKSKEDALKLEKIFEDAGGGMAGQQALIDYSTRAAEEHEE